MDCLIDFIGVRGGCGTSVPPSALYINDLPGITLKQINSLADTQQQTFAGVWTDIQTRAIMRMEDDVRSEFSKRYKLNRIIDSITIPRSKLNRTVLSTIPPVNPLNTIIPNYNWVGCTVNMDYGIDNDGEYINSPLMNLHVQEVWVFIPFAFTPDTVNLRIYDMGSGDILVSKTFTASPDEWNKIEINDTFLNSVTNRSRKIGIFYNINTPSLGPVEPYKTDVSGIRDEGVCCQLYFRGAAFNGAITDAVPLVEGDDSYGVLPVLGIQCDFASLVCSQKDVFKRPFLYALGYETMMEQAYSDRLNEYSLVRRAQAMENMERYLAEYRESLKQVIGSIDLGCDCCIECGGKEKPYITEQTP